MDNSNYLSPYYKPRKISSDFCVGSGCNNGVGLLLGESKHLLDAHEDDFAGSSRKGTVHILGGSSLQGSPECCNNKGKGKGYVGCCNNNNNQHLFQYNNNGKNQQFLHPDYQPRKISSDTDEEMHHKSNNNSAGSGVTLCPTNTSSSNKLPIIAIEDK